MSYHHNSPFPRRAASCARALARVLAPLVIPVLVLALAPTAEGYIGPGAGFALVGGSLVIVSTIFLVFVLVLSWPFRMLYRRLRRGPKPKGAVKRLIVVGLDGQDPRITDRFLAEGKLPNFQRLKDMGCYRSLRSTYPSISPVAWSSFSTGTHPAKHNIYDFLDRDLRTYLPKLSSTHIGTVEKYLNIGPWKFPLKKPDIRLLRRSKPFWTILGDHGIWSTVLRVPITFPPDRFYGAELSAMCVPDLLGSQGTFLLFTTRPSDAAFKEGGLRFLLDGDPTADRFETQLEGPENSMRKDERPLAIPMTIDVDRAARKARLKIGEEELELPEGELSDWVKLEFPAAPGIKVAGLTRMQVTEMDEHFSLYMTPLNIDPDKPAMPISHPSYYATYLAKKVGPFATLGLAEDTWSLNEDVVDDGTFLTQTWDIDEERQKMFFASMDRLKRGSLVCVFDGTDRIQHMFWRYTEDGHPAAVGKEGAEHSNAIEELYVKNDELVGKVMDRLEEGDMLFVISDHGFTSFRRGVNLNAWLLENGYLTLKEGTDGSTEWLRDVDWSKTRVYSLGLSGMFLNLKGREGEGIVERGAEAEALKAEIIEKLSGLRDEEKGEVGIVEVFDTAKLYDGPYLINAPDFIIGYNHGYRISWDGASGVLTEPVFTDNTKAWSGDHCVDPRLVPGVLFCNHPIDDEDPALMDMAPTALQLFGIRPPRHMDGKSLFREGFEMAKGRAAGKGKGEDRRSEAA